MCTKLHLGIDAVGAKHGGAAVIVQGVVEAAIRHEAIERVSVFCSPAALRRFGLPDDARLWLIDRPDEEKSRVARWRWLSGGVNSAARERGCDRLLCLSGGGGGLNGPPFAIYIQQSLPFCGEALARCSVGDRVRMAVVRRSMRRASRTARAVLVQTEAMRQTVGRAFSLDESRITVCRPVPTDLPLGIGCEGVAKTMRDCTGPRFLYVGNDSPYKNVQVAVDAVRQVQAHFPDARLFVTWPPEHPACDGTHVCGIGYLDRPALRRVYGLATALIMPSLTETVCLPLMEAIACGTPAMAADRPYAREACANAAWYFDPSDSRDLAGKLLALLRCSDALPTLRQHVQERAAELAQLPGYRSVIDAAVQVQS